MTNKLLTKQTKPTQKSAKSKPAPAPARPVEVAAPTSQRKVAGLPEERYYRASSALEDIGRATRHQQDKKLMGDIKKVAEHKVREAAEVAKTVGGGKGRR